MRKAPQGQSSSARPVLHIAVALGSARGSIGRARVFYLQQMLHRLLRLECAQRHEIKGAICKKQSQPAIFFGTRQQMLAGC
jgi:hypothetical protein